NFHPFSYFSTDKAYKEIEDVLCSSSFSYQDLKKLPYTNAVLHEIQRSKYTLITGIPRQTAKDVKMRGFLIPKGTIIVPNLRSVLLDPEHWESPKEFNPKHFLDQDGHFVAREAFGAGKRNSKQLVIYRCVFWGVSMIRSAPASDLRESVQLLLWSTDSSRQQNICCNYGAIKNHKLIHDGSQ
uniref:Uncharacterized protein n=1 Tax=Anolis carolinensis TaxID=28377 RepID=R4GAV8_ANOCA